MQVDDEKVTVEHPKQNTASRLYLLLRTLGPLLQGSDGSISTAWVRAAGGNPSDVGSELDHDATQVLRAFGTAINDLSRELSSNSVPDHLWATHMVSLARLSESKWLHKAKEHTLGSFDSHAMQALQWMAFVLPGDRLAADDGDIDELKRLLAELENALLQDGVPFALRQFGQEQLQAFREALLLYSIKGTGPLQKAARSSLVELHAHATDLQAQYEAAPNKAPVTAVFKWLAGTYKGVTKAAGEVEKSLKTWDFLRGKAQEGIKLLENLSDSMPPNPPGA